MNTDQMTMLTGKKYEEHVAFWKQQLSTVESEFAIRSSRARSSDSAVPAGSYEFSLSDQAISNIRALANNQDLATFVVTLSGLLLVLSRFAGRRVVSVRTPLLKSNQEAARLAKDVLVVEAVEEEITIKDLLTRLQKTVSQSYRFQDVPLERLVEDDKSGVASNTNVFVSAPQIHQGDDGREGYDLVFEINEIRETVRIKVTYNTAVCDGGFVRTIASCIDNVLTSYRSLNRRLGDVCLMSDDEARKYLCELNDTSADYPASKTISELFEEQAKRTPNQIALGFQDVVMTYQELNEKADRMADYLRRVYSVGADDLVGVMVTRSPNMVIGLLGILKAGAGYVPIDPQYPKERIDYMIGDARLKALLIDSQLSAKADAFNGIPVEMGNQDDFISGGERPPEKATDARNLAYVIYTSGSTGKPKGVQITHRSVVNLLHSMSRLLRPSSADTFLAVSSLSFDIAALEIFLPLICGARLEIASQDEVSDGPRLRSRIQDCKATIMQATPATYRMLFESGWPGDRRLRVLCGGDALSPRLANQLLESNAELWNLYGPTETTIWSTAHKIDAAQEVVPIGLPIANTQVYLLDDNFRPVPPDLPGELYIAGDGLSRGYLNRPELTAEVFVPNHFSDEPGSRLYKTGDRARRLEDGRIEFIERVDHQAKIRGYRIELGEIEGVLEQLPGVRQAVVAAREDEEGEKRLVAYIVGDAEQLQNISDLREFVTAKLPDYMIPSAFVLMDSFPLTPNGKIDRKSLPAPEQRRPGLREGYVAPANATQELLAELWADVLHVEQVGIYDNFFELGGDSLVGTQVIIRVQELFQVELPLRILFSHATVSLLAEWVEANASPESDEMARVASILEALERMPAEEVGLAAEERGT